MGHRFHGVGRLQTWWHHRDHDHHGRDRGTGVQLQGDQGPGRELPGLGADEGLRRLRQALRASELAAGGTRSSDPLLVEANKPCGVIEEIPGYVWDKAREGSAAAAKAPKEEPRKVDDHGADALRYMVAHLDLQPTPRMRGWL